MNPLIAGAPMPQEDDGAAVRGGCGRPGTSGRRWASWVAANPDAAPGVAVYVLAKDEGRWRIVVAQNTTVIDPETRTALTAS
ncbi:hypothetical protein [Streptomyces sp. NPDC014006]|uniref:hypothetical protein n=1 Tax=Streptomyces sp. NPDC014006 TaxID=3364870 RepID=UPI0036FC6779